MANTYTQLYVHVVFAVKGRANLLAKTWRATLHQYMAGIIKNKNQKPMIINGVDDHVHILIGVKPDCNLSDLVRDIKANSSRWINEQGHVAGKFEWQTGFGAFTVGASQVHAVIKYILEQEGHHRTKTFREEYIDFLRAYEIEFNPEYIFEEVGGAPPEEIDGPGEGG